MNFRISSKEFYNRQNQEIKRFLNNNKKTLHISLDQENTKNFPGQEQAEFLFVNDGSDLFFELNKLITDLFEISDDIYHLLQITKTKLSRTGKVLISTINPKWKIINNILEILKIKKSIRKSSNTKLKKIISIARSCGLEFNYFYTKQVFPFKILGVGRILNKVFELLFFKFNLGIKSYILFSNISDSNEKMTKSVIIPAKNESKNLELLFKDFP